MDQRFNELIPVAKFLFNSSDTNFYTMINFLIAIGVIFFLMMGWILVQQASRKFAARHPELGPAREEGLGCGKTCGCKPGSCDKQ